MGYIGVEPIPKASLVRTNGTTVSITDTIVVPGGFTSGNIEVYIDGLYLQPDDYDDSDGQTLVFPQNLPSGTDYIIMEARNFEVANHFTKAESDVRYVLKEDTLTPNQPIGDIGVPGTYGFGVGVYDDNAELATVGLSPFFGYNNQISDSFGNYLHDNGSVMVFIPKFYYRIGDATAPQYDRYGLNTVEIRGTKWYANEAEANADGFVLHRAFIDGGVEKKGFFYDKYTASKSPTDSNISVSVKNGIPISLTTDANYTNSSGMTDCVGQLHDSIVLSRARGAGYQVATLFMQSALGLLALAHAQNSTNNSVCGWLDLTDTTNYPKGCNDNSLGDVNDAFVSYQSAGDSGTASKPKTGSGEPFNRTTHNGQDCGICDVNGGMWEVQIGLTQAGSSSTASGSGIGNTIYLLKESVAIGDLTNGWNGTTDVWGNSSHLSTLYDSVTAPVDLNNLSGSLSWGNGAEQVFFTDQSGVNRAMNGVIAKSDFALSSSGTNMLGGDWHRNYTRENMFVHSCGSWVGAALAGVFARAFNIWRSNSATYSSFRSARYVS